MTISLDIMISVCAKLHGTFTILYMGYYYIIVHEQKHVDIQ